MARASNSKLNRFKRCRHKFFYNDVLKIARKKKSLAPNKGTLIHEALQEHYAGKDWTKPIEDFEPDMEHVFDEEREEWMKLQGEAYNIVRGYLTAYKKADTSITTLATEVQFSIELGRHEYTGTIDWIFEDADGVWIGDHKTVKILPDLQDLYMDAQLLMYYKAALQSPELQEIIGDRTVRGIIFNHIKSVAPKQPKLLKNGGMSKAACSTDIATYFEALRREGLDPKDYEDMIPKLSKNVFFRRAKIPVKPNTLDILVEEAKTTMVEIDYYKKLANEADDPNDVKHRFPRTLMKDRCSWDCDYYKICLAELAGMDTTTIIEDEYEERKARYDD